MLIVTIQVDAPIGQAVGVKEDLASYLEKFGDARVVSVVEDSPEQIRIDEGWNYGERKMSRVRR